jgi:type II secretory pathway pseudopilin PulG
MRPNGFSILEALVGIALMLTITAVAMALVDPASADVQLERTDMQQRLRVAAGALYKDLVMAGAGAYRGANRGALSYYFAPILPYRQGTNHDDAAGTFKADTITVMYVPPTMAQTTLATSGPLATSADIGVNSDAGCPLSDAACGFRNGMAALLFDASGDYETFTITNVQANLLHLERTGGSLTYADYQPNATSLVQLASILYYLKSDTSTGTYQLMSREGGTGADVPVVDHLVALTFVYYGDPQPPRLRKASSDPVGPWTTYGPPPPALGQQVPTGGYAAGENCTFTIDPISGLEISRLAVIDSGGGTSALVELTSAQLTDGPWCPDSLSPNRWDADLLRIRRIGVTLRIESAVAALRGPASVLFTHSGTSTSGNKWLPDQQVTFEVSPRNLGR